MAGHDVASIYSCDEYILLVNGGGDQVDQSSLSAALDPSWRGSVGYEVYLPSFQDSDADGWGDLAGLTGRLGYLRELGVDLIWVTPFYPSPMRDHGYDVSGYTEVASRFGTMADFDQLIEQAHQLGMTVIADLVVNHTSDLHPWFASSRSSRQDPYRDYYIWRDPGPFGGPPNNWLSHFGGPAWTYDPQTGQYYLRLFTPHQPDLNWDNAAVADEVDAIISFWLGRGLDGFRVDAAHYLVKHPGLPDNPVLPEGETSRLGGGVSDWLRQDHRHEIGQPAVTDIHRRWRVIADKYRALLIGEIYLTDPLPLAAYVNEAGLHSAFFFGLVESGWEPEAIGSMLAGAVSASPSLSWVQSSHDRPRAVTRYGGGQLGWRRWLAVSTLLAAVPGPMFLYQGEELGLADADVLPEHDEDPLAGGGGTSRSGCRTPMPWEPGPALGFTSAQQAWLPSGNRPDTDTVAVQLDCAAAPLALTRRLLAARRELAGACGGQVDWLALGPVVAFRHGDVLAAANLGDQALTLDPGDGTWRVRFDTEGPDSTAAGPVPASDVIAGPVVLAPLQAVLAVRQLAPAAPPHLAAAQRGRNLVRLPRGVREWRHRLGSLWLPDGGCRRHRHQHGDARFAAQPGCREDPPLSVRAAAGRIWP
jgi:alpha-glucosidase